jgi:hypothetical protein
MDVDIYTGDDGLRALLVRRGADVTRVVPEATRNGFKNLKRWKTVRVEANKPLVGASPSLEILQNLERYGYHENMSEIRITEVVGGIPLSTR